MTAPARPAARAPLPPELARIRGGLVLAFLVTGIGMGSWVTRTPALRDSIGASTSDMGLIIAGLSVGSVVGIGLGGWLVARMGARFVVACGMAGITLGVAVVGVGAALGSGPVAALGLALFGYGMGSGEIGQNVEGVELEVRVGRSVVPGLHGCYSLGTCAGGLAGLGANIAGVAVLPHLLAVSSLIGGASLWLVSRLPAATGSTRATPVPAGAASARAGERPGTPGRLAWVDKRLLALGVIILGMALAEGSANDWLPLIIVDGYGLTAATGAIIYAFFGLSMAIGRFSGGRVIDRHGRAVVMAVSAIIGAAGIAAVSLAPSLWLAAVGVLLWGLGASLGFPVALSAAGDDPAHAARRASAVATAGYAAFLIGPPMLGFIGEEVGLRGAILVVLAAVLATAAFAPAVRERRPTASSGPPTSGTPRSP